jgi:PPK2 family polyphosphate:nucleotide phosphotransferase
MKYLKINEIKTTSPKEVQKQKAKSEFHSLQQDIYTLQHLFYAAHSKSLLIIFQGIDTSGKDGVIRKVFNCVNPLGVHATSFKAPCDMEREHDYMWRIFQKLPEKGMIQIFNRSYYEDIIVPSIQKSFAKTKIDKRYNFINAFEEHLIENGTDIIKFYLHISPDEQKNRIQKRLKNPLKKWKYSDNDIEASKRWDDYMVVYENIINRCNQVPWIIVPSDEKWYRDFIVASVIKEKLKAMNLKFPKQNALSQNDKAVEKK